MTNWCVACQNDPCVCREKTNAPPTGLFTGHRDPEIHLRIRVTDPYQFNLMPGDKSAIEWALSVIDNLRADKERLTSDLARSEAETAACLDYLRSEMHWENFRAEMNSCGIDPEKASFAERNAAKLLEFLNEGNRGEKVLAEIERLTRQLAELDTTNRALSLAANELEKVRRERDGIETARGVWQKLYAYAVAERDQLREQLAAAKMAMAECADKAYQIRYGLTFENEAKNLAGEIHSKLREFIWRKEATNAKTDR